MDNERLNQQTADAILEWFVDNGLVHKRQLEVRIDIHRIEGFLNSLVSEGMPLSIDPMFMPHPVGARYVEETDTEIAKRNLDTFRTEWGRGITGQPTIHDYDHWLSTAGTLANTREEE